MTDRLDDARWRAAVDAHAGGDANDAQRALVAGFVPEDGDAAAEHALLRAVADLEGAPEKDDDAIIDRAVTGFLRERAQSGRDAPARTGTWRWIAVGTVAAAVALGSAAVWRPWQRASVAPMWTGPLADVAVAPTPAGGPEARPQPSPAPDRAWVLDSGTLAVADQGTLPLGVETVARTRSCARHDDTQVCIDAGSEFVARDDDGEAVIELAEGTAEIVSASSPSSMQVVVGGAHVVVGAASEVVITVSKTRWSVEVRRGSATALRGGSPATLVAGERLHSGATPARTAVTAEALLAQARALRSKGDLDGAARAYGKLVGDHAGSPLAASAQVALGEIHLERRRPRPALAAFDRYLRRGGPLAEEAAFGRIRALRALGRNADADDAAAAFERRHPGSAYAGKLRAP